MPGPIQSRHIIRESNLDYSRTAAACRAFEDRFGFSSEVMLDRVAAGNLVPDHNMQRWLGYYSILCELTPPAASDLADKADAISA